MPQPAPDFLYFAFGSNMSSRRLTAPGRAPSATRVTVGYVPGRRLTFDKFSTRDRSGKCDCEATGVPADRVYGVVYRIDMSERAALDEAEGLHRGYRDEILTVIAEDPTTARLRTSPPTSVRVCRSSTGIWNMCFVVQPRMDCRRTTSSRSGGFQRLLTGTEVVPPKNGPSTPSTIRPSDAFTVV